MQRKAVFFDRDGVLNKADTKNGKPIPPENADKLEITENAKELLLSLKQKGFLLIAITNQPDFARGKRSLDNIIDMNKKVCLSLPLDDMFCCLHDDKDNCNCRKPKPGMILEAQEKWKVDLKKSFLIGDRKGDILAGKAAGVKTIFIDYNYNEAKPTDSDFVCQSLAEAVNFIEKSNVKKGGNK